MHWAWLRETCKHCGADLREKGDREKRLMDDERAEEKGRCRDARWDNVNKDWSSKADRGKQKKTA